MDEELRDPSVTDGLWPRLLRCADSPSCKALAACSGVDFRGGSAAEGACKPSCAGGIEESCGRGPRLRLECARAGQTCSARGTRCVMPAARPCDASFTPRCDGQRPVNCVDGEEQVGDDCAVAGLVCDLATPEHGDEQRAARCRGEGPSCAPRSADGRPFQCDGDALVTCVAGRVHRTTCERLVPGSRCRSFGDPDRPSFACLRGGECDPHARTSSRCDGSVLTFCNAGLKARVDCKDLGFVTCLGSCILAYDAL